MSPPLSSPGFFVLLYPYQSPPIPQLSCVIFSPLTQTFSKSDNNLVFAFYINGKLYLNAQLNVSKIFVGVDSCNNYLLSPSNVNSLISNDSSIEWITLFLDFPTTLLYCCYATLANPRHFVYENILYFSSFPSNAYIWLFDDTNNKHIVTIQYVT